MLFLAVSSVVSYRAWRITERANAKYEVERETNLGRGAGVGEGGAAGRIAARFQECLRPGRPGPDLRPDHADARLLKAQLLIVEFKFTEAGKELGRYLELRPADRNASRLRELCGRRIPDEPSNLLAIAHIFQQQQSEAMADALLTKYFKNGGNAFKVRQKLLDLYQKRIEKAWGKLPNTHRLQMDAHRYLHPEFEQLCPGNQPCPSPGYAAHVA